MISEAYLSFYHAIAQINFLQGNDAIGAELGIALI